VEGPGREPSTCHASGFTYNDWPNQLQDFHDRLLYRSNPEEPEWCQQPI
jgi:hypothetical protein